MAKSPNQKLKLLTVMDLLLQTSDGDHPVSMKAILEHLERQGIAAERKSVYDDIEVLRSYGMDILTVQDGQSKGYFVGERNFELAELKLLVDSVQSSKFITRKKSLALIKKIEQLASTHQAKALQRQVFVTNRIKTMNESIYYNVDEIHNGISNNRKIRFKYFDLTVKKERQYRKDGAWYEVSPFALTWDDENYYLVAYDSGAGIIKHYRVDKMTNIAVTGDPRDGLAVYDRLDMAVYARKIFGMFSGEEQWVDLRFDNHLVGAVLDRLGSEVILHPDGEDHFTVRAQVVPSPQFFAWVFGFGEMARITGPAAVVQQMQEQLARVGALYPPGVDNGGPDGL